MSLEERAASIPTGTEEYPSNRQFIIPRVEEDLGFAKGGIVSLVDTAEDVRVAGRNNDTVLAHISPEQAYFLKRVGGAGTINPKTGLLEFSDGSYGFDYGYWGQDDWYSPISDSYGGYGGDWGDDSNNQNSDYANVDPQSAYEQAYEQAYANLKDALTNQDPEVTPSFPTLPGPTWTAPEMPSKEDYTRAIEDLKEALSSSAQTPEAPAEVNTQTASVINNTGNNTADKTGPSQMTSSTGPTTTAAPSEKPTNFVDNVTSYISDKVSNAFSNPAQLATNVAVGLVPGLGPLNTVSGILGGPTVGSVLFGNTANQTGPSQMTSSTGYDLTSQVPGSSDYAGFGGTQGQVFLTDGSGGGGSGGGGGGEGPTEKSSQDLALNTSVIYDLSKYLSSQNTNQAPANISPYVGVPSAATVAPSTAPQFSSISYPTAPT
jgi:hypothetical protein